MPTIEAYFDGCCEPKNPGGHAAYGALVIVDGVRVLEEGGYCGFGKKMSNNVAEYSGVVRVLEEITKHPGTALIRGDSKLVVGHLYGFSGRKWKVNGGLYLPYYLEAKSLLAPMMDRVKLEWIPRDQNSLCDVLSKKVLLDRGVEFKIQPEVAA